MLNLFKMHKICVSIQKGVEYEKLKRFGEIVNKNWAHGSEFVHYTPWEKYGTVYVYYHRMGLKFSRIMEVEESVTLDEFLFDHDSVITEEEMLSILE